MARRDQCCVPRIFRGRGSPTFTVEVLVLTCLAGAFAGLAERAVAAEAQDFEIRIDDFFGVEGYGRKYVVTPEQVTITTYSDVQGVEPKTVWQSKLSAAQSKDMADFLAQFPLKGLEEKYVNRHVCDGTQVGFFVRNGQGESKSFAVANMYQLDLVALAQQVNQLVPDQHKTSYGRVRSLDQICQQPVTKWPSWYYSSAPNQSNPKALAEVPPPIRQKAEALLIERCGEEFYKKLEFSGGQIIEDGIRPYSLHFKFSLPEKGLAAYHVQLELDREGNTLAEINFPAVAKNKEKGKIIPFKDALKIAQQQGIPFGKVNVHVEIGYKEALDSLVWVVASSLPIESKDKSVRSRVVIDAHSGAVLHDEQPKQ